MERCNDDLGVQGHLNGDADGFGPFRGIASSIAIYLFIGLLWGVL